MSFGLLTEEQAAIMRKRMREQYAPKEVFTGPGIVGESTCSLCMHDNCPLCHGTGIREDGLGMCIHGMSCTCPKCSVR